MSDVGGGVERGGCVEVIDVGGEEEEEEEEVTYLVSVCTFVVLCASGEGV